MVEAKSIRNIQSIIYQFKEMLDEYKKLFL
jgi:hypothetical protein